MSRLFAGIVAGALAGAAGATALNAVSFADTAVRGRPASTSPAGTGPKATVDAAAEATGTEVPGEGEQATNRAAGGGELAGLGVGVGIGAVAGVLRAFHVKVPKALSPFALGLGAMALSDGVMSALGVTDPRGWSAKRVTADALPHLAYGLVATAALHRMLDPRTPQVR